jgi:hypothetical protein
MGTMAQGVRRSDCTLNFHEFRTAGMDLLSGKFRLVVLNVRICQPGSISYCSVVWLFRAVAI